VHGGEAEEMGAPLMHMRAAEMQMDPIYGMLNSVVPSPTLSSTEFPPSHGLSQNPNQQDVHCQHGEAIARFLREVDIDNDCLHEGEMF